ncbi:hypothetical protein GGE20_004338 [Rhizobium leguminosarum]|nr:hypothetical protein [Rhizobium leguminosarum]
MIFALIGTGRHSCCRHGSGEKKSHFGIPKFPRFGIPKFAAFSAPSPQGNMQ